MPTENRSSNTEMVSVPRAPTPEMLAAAKKSGVIDPRVSGYCYELMLAAAPAELRQDNAIGTLVRDYNERIVFTPIGDPHIIDDMKVYAHADPGEVERLRNQVDTLTEWYANALNKLAERDAVLRDTKRCIERNDYPVFELLKRIDAALPASAEPSAPVERDEHEGFSEACREAALAKGREIDPNALERRPDGSHVNPLVECGWWGWQARAALERKPS